MQVHFVFMSQFNTSGERIYASADAECFSFLQTFILICAIIISFIYQKRPNAQMHGKYSCINMFLYIIKMFYKKAPRGHTRHKSYFFVFKIPVIHNS